MKIWKIFNSHLRTLFIQLNKLIQIRKRDCNFGICNPWKRDYWIEKEKFKIFYMMMNVNQMIWIFWGRIRKFKTQVIFWLNSNCPYLLKFKLLNNIIRIHYLYSRNKWKFNKYRHQIGKTWSKKWSMSYNRKCWLTNLDWNLR